jgi:hypothetical protein
MREVINGPIQIKGKKILIDRVEGKKDLLIIIRTCSRKTETLTRTIESMNSVGFEDPIILNDDRNLGSFWSFQESMKIATEKHTGWVMICEDDVLFCRSIKRILNEIKIEPFQTVSLFCTDLQNKFLEGDKWNLIKSGDLDGSLAYLVHTEALIKILNSRTFRSWKLRDRVDKAYTEACRELSIDFITHRPSLTQHIGETSTINPYRVLDFRRKSLNWRENF